MRFCLLRLKYTGGFGYLEPKCRSGATTIRLNPNLEPPNPKPCVQVTISRKPFFQICSVEGRVRVGCLALLTRDLDPALLLGPGPLFGPSLKSPNNLALATAAYMKVAFAGHVLSARCLLRRNAENLAPLELQSELLVSPF